MRWNAADLYMFVWFTYDYISEDDICVSPMINALAQRLSCRLRVINSDHPVFTCRDGACTVARWLSCCRWVHRLTRSIIYSERQIQAEIERREEGEERKIHVQTFSEKSEDQDAKIGWSEPQYFFIKLEWIFYYHCVVDLSWQPGGSVVELSLCIFIAEPKP